MKIAAIDVGTNTAKLLVAVLEDGRLRPLVEEARYVRLGEGMGRNGRVGTPALKRLERALTAFKCTAASAGVGAVVACGTSASRDAENRDELIRFVREATGMDYEILSGEEEAAWSFAGALSAFDEEIGLCVMLDIGGGSTEVVVGETGPPPRIAYRRSLQLGTVRLSERFFSAQPPARSEVQKAREEVVRCLQKVEVSPERELPLIGSSGTLKVLARLHAPGNDLPLTLSRADVHRWRERLLALSYDEVLALNPSLMQGRADVFPAGVLILDLFMERFGFARCRVSPRGLRHGLALRYAAKTA